MWNQKTNIRKWKLIIISKWTENQKNEQSEEGNTISVAQCFFVVCDRKKFEWLREKWFVLYTLSM